jgi:hypothetical protein
VKISLLSKKNPNIKLGAIRFLFGPNFDTYKFKKFNLDDLIKFLPESKDIFTEFDKRFFVVQLIWTIVNKLGNNKQKKEIEKYVNSLKIEITTSLNLNDFDEWISMYWSSEDDLTFF